MASKKNKTQLEVELRVLKQSRLADVISQVFTNLIRWGAILGVARYGYLAIEVLAGKNTVTDIGINFFSEIKVSVALAWGSGIGGALYGLKQRKLRKDTVERLQGRIIVLEEQHDPDRSSSNLTIRGDTRPEDEI